MDTNSAAWKTAIGACKDLQPPGFTGRKASPEGTERAPQVRPVHPRQRREGLPGSRQRRAPRRHESHPIRGNRRRHEPFSTPRCTSAAMSTRTSWESGEANDVGAGRPGRRSAWCGSPDATPAAAAPANTVKVETGELSAMVSLPGTLTYRARSDGSPYSVINQARGTYTKLPAEGDKVDCGDVLYRVDETRCSCCAARSRPIATCTSATGARTPVSSSGTCQLGYHTDPGRGSPGVRQRSKSSSATRAFAGPERSLSVTRSSCPSRRGSPR